jgi:CRP/FNR family transcriptional regulator
VTARLRDLLAHHGGWERLSPAALDVLDQAAEERVLGPRRALFHRGDVGAGLFVLVEGELRLTLTSPDGRQQIVRIVRPGRLVIEALSLEGAPAPLAAFARESCRVLAVPSEGVERAAALDSTLYRLIAVELARRGAAVTDLLFAVALRSVEQRLAAFILQQSDDTAGADSLPRDLDVTTVAALLGTVREEITRAQRRLAEAGVISVTRSSIEILDRAGLEEISLG